ncbi:hypothetical protein D3C80_1782630 [compost metagenome]
MKGQALKLRIRPLIVMEGTVIEPTYMGLGSGEAALNKFSELKDRCKAVKSCFILLWHNSLFDTQAERELYRQLLQ